MFHQNGETEMTYQVTVFNSEGRQTANLGKFANLATARQAMLDHSNTTELPNELPFFAPTARVAEGWFIGRTEYNIEF
jgi:hypothetical protein